MKKAILLLILVLCINITACSSNSLPEITALESMTDAEIKEILIGRNRQELMDQWGEPQITHEETNQDLFSLNPQHLKNGSYKVIVVRYDENAIIKEVFVEYCY